VSTSRLSQWPRNPMKTPRLSLRIPIAVLIVCLGFLTLGCNETGPEVFSVHGPWTGSVTQLELELEMVLIEQGETAVVGFAEMSSPTTGTVQGEVSGSLHGPDVNLTIHIEGVMVAGAIVFDGSFEGENTITGTLSSGLLAGSHDISLQREGI